NGDAASAGFEFDSLAVLYPRSDDALAARYWGGRAWLAAGDTSGANTRWSEVARRDPRSYYAALSARRLGQAPWAPAAAVDSFQVYPGLDSAMARAALLERVGLDREAEWEYAQIVRDAGDSVERLLATADAFRAHGRASQAITLARRALAHGAPADARVYRLIYPATHADALVADATERGLDPAFVAALVRQESMFNPDARSGAGARGLMQLMPKVGHGLAKSLDFPFWDPVLLYQPDVNLQLGTLHLSELARRYDAPVHILAAYNAGASRVDRWREKVGVDDPELFAERIPYTETRDYVRIIQRNEDFYRALYHWDGEMVAASGESAGTAGGR
ncbi:MAG TPA: transglycosylase SLT domain-containing protein, partial [Gemmatimonadales bacterium]|nr:transglycosylase SLT domain-containing protein [Gemmatimonadales bacterium]